MRLFRNRRAVAAVAVACVLGGVACTPGGSSSLSIGVRRVSLDLTLRNEAERIAPPRSPAAPARFDPTAPPQISIPDGPGEPPAAPPVSLCPAAPAGAVPPGPATLGFRAGPAEGTYQYVNEGDVRLEAGPLSLTIPFPFTSPADVANSRSRRVTEPLGDPRTDHDFDIEERLFPHATATRMEITKDPAGRTVMYVRAMSVTAGGQELFQFRPVTPVAWLVLDPNTPDWTSAGVDYATGSVMTVEGSVRGRARVDLCGQVHEGWEVELRQRLVNIRTRFTYDDQGGKVSRYVVAPQLGGIVLSRDVHTTMTIPGELPLVYTLDYTGHLMAPVPRS